MPSAQGVLGGWGGEEIGNPMAIYIIFPYKRNN